MRGQKGFTLVELIVVIAIIAILAAVAIPNFIGLQKRAQRGVDIANATAIASAMNMYNLTATEKLDASDVETLENFKEGRVRLVICGLDLMMMKMWTYWKEH